MSIRPAEQGIGVARSGEGTAYSRAFRFVGGARGERNAAGRGRRSSRTPITLKNFRPVKVLQRVAPG
jgi:hypothetical protein